MISARDMPLVKVFAYDHSKCGVSKVSSARSMVFAEVFPSCNLLKWDVSRISSTRGRIFAKAVACDLSKWDVL